MWTPGETIVVQEVWQGLLWSARPVVVVEDTPDRLVTWCPKGTLRKVPTTPAGLPRPERRGERMAECFARRRWEFADDEWDVSSLMLTEPGAHHSIWVSWLETGEHWGWYVNLQQPFTRQAQRMQTMDLTLDVIIAPDRRTWAWKDEDELQDLVDRDLVDPGAAAALRVEGELVVARALANEAPFSEPWPSWRPPADWALPMLPPDWFELD